MNQSITKNNPPVEMDFFSHLTELRKCLVRSFICVLVLAIASYFFIEDIFAFLCEPYFKYFSNGALIGTGPAEAFVLKIKVAFFSGIIAATPYLFWQVWQFVAPGLMPDEKKYALPFVLSTSVLFLMGASFCYFSVLPVTYEFFNNEYQSIKLTPNIKLGEHLSTVITAILGFGLVFQWPALAFFLGKLGVITHKTLIDGARYAIVIIFIISAVLTPPDVMTQFLMAGPLLVLYALSIVIVKFSNKNPDKALPDTQITNIS